jgi:antiviral helicase SKI2
MHRHIAHMKKGVRALEALVSDWVSSGVVPEVEWSRMRSLDFQEALRSRDELVRKIASNGCMSCASFDEHVSDCPIGGLERR